MPRLLARLVCGTLVTVLLLGSGTLVALELTVAPGVPVGGQLWMADRSRWGTGHYPTGVKVVALSQPVPAGTWNRLLLLAGDGSANAIVTLVASPGQRVRTGSGRLIVDDQPGPRVQPGFQFNADGAHYAAVCVTGVQCPPGQVINLPVDHVLGRAVAGVGSGGWSR